MICKKTVVLALILTVVLLNGQPIFSQPAPLQGLDEYVIKAMNEWDIPGSAIAVVKDDEVFFINGYICVCIH